MVCGRDPIQGLIDYVLDVKPYHTKILEVLIEQLASDDVNVSISEDFKMQVDITTPSISDDCFCQGSYDAYPIDGFDLPFSTTETFDVIGIDVAQNGIQIEGDQRTKFTYSSHFSLKHSTQGNNGSYIVKTNAYDDVNDITTLYVANNILYDIEDNNVFGGQINLTNVGYDDVVYGCTNHFNTCASISDTIQFGWSVTEWFQYFIVDVDLVNNRFFVEGNQISTLGVGTDFEVIGSPTFTNDLFYKVLSSVYNPSTNRTIIKVIPEIPGSTPGGFIQPREDMQMTLVLSDSVSTFVEEIDEPIAPVTTEFMINSFDTNYFDVHLYDETLEVLEQYYF